MVALLAFASADCAAPAADEAVGSTAQAVTRTDLANLALANLGKGACSTNSLGGTSFFSSCTGNGGQPEYWCADFARWVWAKSGASNTSELTAAAGSFYVYGQNHGTLHSKPALGDAVVFNYAGGGYADHVAIVTQVNSDGTIETASGDWNGQSGSEAYFSSTSKVVLNAPAYPGVQGTKPGVIGMTISGFVSPVGVTDAGYAAKFVKQSWPFASSSMTITAGHSVAASLTLQNVGAKAWDANTKLATSNPRDRKSAFVASDWLSDNRLDAVSGSVAPGGQYEFKFTFHAPSAPGQYHEFFNLVEEGVAWFSDPGQGGPADDVIEAWIEVVPADWAAEFVSQSFPLAQAGAVNLAPGDHLDGTIELKNVGTQTWKAGVTKLAPTPRDETSPIGSDGWLSPTRVSSPPSDVPPGGSYKFPVRITANAVGSYTQTFGLVEEGVAWFSDAAQGGPADDFLKVKVVVSDTGAADGGATTDDAGATHDDAGAHGDAGATDVSMNAQSAAGCTTTSAGARGSLAWAIGAALIAIARRRRRG